MPTRRDAICVVGTVALATPGCLAGTATDGSDTADDESETMVAISDGDREIEAITYDQVESVGEIRESQHIDGYQVPVELSDDGVESFTEALETAGAFEAPEDCEIRQYLDEELVNSAALGPNLAEAVEEGKFDG